MSTSAECREYAQQCVDLAERATTERHRATLLGIAEKWIKLADLAQRDTEWIASHGIS
jgi:hypothetical protein